MSTVRPASASRAQHDAQPSDRGRVEAVVRLVEDDDCGITQQRGRQPEALLHAQRHLADRQVGDRADPNQVEHPLYGCRAAIRCWRRPR